VSCEITRTASSYQWHTLSPKSVGVCSKEKDFWEFGQRAAITLPKVGFATTTDVDKSALHPPDKQDIAPRMALEVQRCVVLVPVLLLSL
jgi:hypothetical protein